MEECGLSCTTANAKWIFATGGDVDSSPAIGADGTVFVASYGDGKLHAVEPSALLECGASKDAVDHAGWTPLHRAADARDATALRRLLADGADPRLCAPVAAAAHADMRSALSLIASASYPLALPVDAALRAEVERAATHVRWSRGTHWQCPRDVREAARSRALLLGGRGMPVMNDDVWRVVFSFLIDGEHARRPLRGEGAVLGACCVGGDAAAPCAACRAALYSDGGDGAEGRGAAPSSRSNRARKRVRT